MDNLTTLPDGAIVRLLLDFDGIAFDVLHTVDGKSVFTDEVFYDVADARAVAACPSKASGWQPYTHTAEAAQLWAQVL